MNFLNRHSIFLEPKTYTDFEEVPVNWKNVERLLPVELIPEMPKTQEITPSGWRPPKGLLSRTFN
jgi:hypothetical protein